VTEAHSWLVAAAFALAVGLRHAFEPDHLMAVATMLARRPGTSTAARLGVSWGIGHSVALLLLGSALVVARRQWPEPWNARFEAVVGVMIAVMGLRAIVEAWTARRPAAPLGTALTSAPEPRPQAGAHVTLGPVTVARGPLMVGVMHGVAGSGALTALAIASLPTSVEQIAFMALFGVGSTLGMGAVAAMADRPLARLARLGQAARWVSATTGVMAVAFGAAWAAPLVRTLLSS
jgi:hypothetical protein